MEENHLQIRVDCCASCVFYSAMGGRPSCVKQVVNNAIRPFYHCINYTSIGDTTAKSYIDNVKEVCHGRKA